MNEVTFDDESPHTTETCVTSARFSPVTVTVVPPAADTIEGETFEITGCCDVLGTTSADGVEFALVRFEALVDRTTTV
jgi:hypothetical protein